MKSLFVLTQCLVALHGGPTFKVKEIQSDRYVVAVRTSVKMRQTPWEQFFNQDPGSMPIWATTNFTISQKDQKKYRKITCPDGSGLGEVRAEGVGEVGCIGKIVRTGTPSKEECPYGGEIFDSYACEKIVEKSRHWCFEPNYWQKALRVFGFKVARSNFE